MTKKGHQKFLLLKWNFFQKKPHFGRRKKFLSPPNSAPGFRHCKYWTPGNPKTERERGRGWNCKGLERKKWGRKLEDGKVRWVLVADLFSFFLEEQFNRLVGISIAVVESRPRFVRWSSGQIGNLEEGRTSYYNRCKEYKAGTVFGTMAMRDWHQSIYLSAGLSKRSILVPVLYAIRDHIKFQPITNVSLVSKTIKNTGLPARCLSRRKSVSSWIQIFNWELDQYLASIQMLWRNEHMGRGDSVNLFFHPGLDWERLWVVTLKWRYINSIDTHW